jgi:hypothetical protein
MLASIIWLAAIASLAGCSLVTIKSPEKPLSTRDLNERILMHEYSAHFIGAVQQTADQIAAGSEDSPVRLNTLRWKIAAAASSERAASQIVPMMSLIDSWALSVQMEQYLGTGAGRELFGAQQPQAVELAAELARDAESLARRLTSSEEFANDRRFVDNYAHDYPLVNLSFARASVLNLWVRDSGTQSKLIDTLGTVPESIAEARDLIRMYGETGPDQMLWKAQLAAQESGLSGEDLQSALKRLDERMARLSAMADATPDLIHGVVRDVQKRVDTSWTQMLGELRTQGTALSSRLGTEREAATDAIDVERAAMTADASRIATQVVHDAGVEVRRLVREALLLMIVLAVVMLGLPFTAGYLVGRARRQS